MPGHPVAGFSSVSRLACQTVSDCDRVPGANEMVSVRLLPEMLMVAPTRSGDTAARESDRASPAGSVTVPVYVADGLVILQPVRNKMAIAVTEAGSNP